MELRDPVSSASHLLTAAWAAYATLVLVRLGRGERSRQLGLAVYGLSMVLLYLASGTFHGVPFTRTENPDEFRFFQKLDHSAIFVLIAGTNTPTMLVVLGGSARRWFLRVLWGFALGGIACIWLLPKAPHAALVFIFIGMGWIGVLPGIRYYRMLGWRAMNWVWLGAAFYTLGAVCELAQWPVISDWPVRVGFHEVMHGCDIAGTLAFFVFVVRYVVPYEPLAASPRGEAASGGNSGAELS